MAYPDPTTYSTPGSYTFTADATGTLSVECWGGGGGGACGSSGSSGGGGGGGGAYAQGGGIMVSSGDMISVFVGAGGAGVSDYGAGNAGGDSAFGTDVLAKGGAGGAVAGGGSGGQGGQASSSTGTTKYSGGNGGDPNFGDYGAGGGSSAGTASNGNDGQDVSAGGIGGSAVTGGGAGGNGAHNLGEGEFTEAVSGSAPGGGGGGTTLSGPEEGSGAGGAGKVIVSWADSPPPSGPVGFAFWGLCATQYTSGGGGWGGPTPSAYYRFQNNDTSSPGNNLAFAFGANSGYGDGKIAVGFISSGNTNSTFNSNTVYDSGTEWSLSFWFRIPSGGGTVLLYPVNSSFSNYVEVTCNATSVTAGALPSGSASVTGLSDGTWYFVTMTNTGTTFKLYFNGSLQSTVTGKSGFSTLYISITGIIDLDELGCWNAALSADNVTMLYNGGTGFDPTM